jgi:hypothetical protein
LSFFSFRFFLVILLLPTRKKIESVICPLPMSRKVFEIKIRIRFFLFFYCRLCCVDFRKINLKNNFLCCRYSTK